MAQTIERRSDALEVAERLAGAGKWDHWRYALIVAVLTVGACMFSTFLVPGMFGLHQWLLMGDTKWTIQSAQYVSFGGLGYVYSVNVQFLPLPGFLLVLAPFVALGDHLGLVNGYPISLAHPSMLLVAAPVFFVCGASSILGIDYLASTLGVGLGRRRLLAPAIAAFVVLPTCCWAGHPEDLLALTLSCVSLALVLRNRHLGAAAVLAVAIMMQPWALLLIPLLVVCAPPRLRVRSVLYSSTLPAVTGLTLLALDFKDASRSLILQPMQGLGQHLPWWGFSRPMVVHLAGAATSVRVGSGPRALAVVTAVVAAWMIRRDVRPTTILGVASVVLAARGIFETQVWCYYLAPAAVFMVLLSSTAPKTGRWACGALAAFGFYAYAAAGYDSYSMPAMLALVIMVACTLMCLGAAFWRPAPRLAALEAEPLI